METQELINKNEFPNLTFLRSFYIDKGRKQKIYFEPSQAKIIIGLETMRLISLEDFIQWVKIQTELIHLLLSVQSTLAPFFQVKYNSYQSPVLHTDTSGAGMADGGVNTQSRIG